MRTHGDGAGSKRTVLVVDDEPNTAAIVTRLAEQAGFQVHTSTSPEDALAIAGRARIDLIICDIEMPGLRGPALLRQLKDRGVKCPVLFISGAPTPDNLDDSLNVARAMFLPKPFTATELTDAIWEALKL